MPFFLIVGATAAIAAAAAAVPLPATPNVFSPGRNFTSIVDQTTFFHANRA